MDFSYKQSILKIIFDEIDEDALSLFLVHLILACCKTEFCNGY